MTTSARTYTTPGDSIRPAQNGAGHRPALNLLDLRGWGAEAIIEGFSVVPLLRPEATGFTSSTFVQVKPILSVKI